VSSRRSRVKKVATPERPENTFAREFMEIARQVVTHPADHRCWKELSDLWDAYEGKKKLGIAPR